MGRFHLNSSGEAGACRARRGKCPFGAEADHHDSPEAARASYEESMAEKIFLSPSRIATNYGILENITPGKIDEPALMAYTSGQCIALAVEVAKALRGEILVVSRDGEVFHTVAVKNGKIYDIRGNMGKRDFQKLFRNSGEYFSGKILSPESVEQSASRKTGVFRNTHEQDYLLAKSFVRPVVERE